MLKNFRFYKVVKRHISKENINFIMPYWMIFYYAFYIGIIVIELHYYERNNIEYLRGPHSQFWWLVVCLLGIRAGIRYHHKQRIGILAGLSIITSPILIIHIFGASARIIYYYIIYNLELFYL